MTQSNSLFPFFLKVLVGNNNGASWNWIPKSSKQSFFKTRLNDLSSLDKSLPQFYFRFKCGWHRNSLHRCIFPPRGITYFRAVFVPSQEWENGESRCSDPNDGDPKMNLKTILHFTYELEFIFIAFTCPDLMRFLVSMGWNMACARSTLTIVKVQISANAAIEEIVP